MPQSDAAAPHGIASLVLPHQLFIDEFVGNDVLALPVADEVLGMRVLEQAHAGCERIATGRAEATNLENVNGT